MNFYTTTDAGGTKIFEHSFTSLPAVGDDGLKKMEFVYDRVNDQIECIFDGTSLGTTVTDAAHRNATGIILRINDQYSPSTGGLGIDDVYIGNVPSN